jgi:hypothetical protein
MCCAFFAKLEVDYGNGRYFQSDLYVLVDFWDRPMVVLPGLAFEI